jgi:hypothetical protein
MRHTLRRIAIVIAGATILSLAAGGTGTADPRWFNDGSEDPNWFVPDSTDLVGIGSATNQYVMNTAAHGITNQDVAQPNRVASFNACDPLNPTVCGQLAPPIVVRQGTQPVPRPDNGIVALLQDDADGGVNLFDFARSARGPQGTEGDLLYFVPALRDELRYIVAENSVVPLDLTVQALNGIYRCTDPNGFHPLLPQAGSGTRQFFLASIGLSDGMVGDCVTSVQEDDYAQVVDDPLALLPFTTARWAHNPTDPDNPPSEVTRISSTAVGDRTIFNVAHKDEFDADVNGLTTLLGAGGKLCTWFATPANREGFLEHPDCGEPVNP